MEITQGYAQEKAEVFEMETQEQRLELLKIWGRYKQIWTE